MTTLQKSAFISLAVLVWSFVGLSAGFLLGFSWGLEGRQLLFLAVVGLAVGWFGASGIISRVKTDRDPNQTDGHDSFQAGTLSEEILSPEEARRWLDDFLVKQQRELK